MKANLSRVHHIARDMIEEYYRIDERINSMRLEFSFRIFEKTTEAEYEAFRGQLAKRKEEYQGLVKRMAKLLAYSDYLKILLAGANEECGISARLTRAASLGREISTLQNFIAKVAESHSLQLNAIQPMDFYKSAFTDQNRIYDLPVYLFDEKDMGQLRAKLRNLLQTRQALNDEIANLNQTNTLDIMTFDEFMEAGKEQITV